MPSHRTLATIEWPAMFILQTLRSEKRDAEARSYIDALFRCGDLEVDGGRVVPGADVVPWEANEMYCLAILLTDAPGPREFAQCYLVRE